MKEHTTVMNKKNITLIAASMVVAVGLMGCTTKLISESVDHSKVKEQTVEAAKKAPILEIDEEKKKEENKYTLEFKVPRLTQSGNKKTEDLVNALLKKDADDLRNDVIGSRTDLENDPEMAGKTDSPIFQYFASSEIISQKVESEYMSLAMGYSSYTGGAHGMYNVVPYNYKISDGKVFTLKDVLADPEADLKVINAEIAKQIKSKQIELYEDAKAQIDLHYDLFYIKDQTLVVFYNSYAIAPYAAGTLYFEIPLKELHMVDWVK